MTNETVPPIDPEMEADLQRLTDRIHAQLETYEGIGPAKDTMRLVIDIPVEWAALAAWVNIRSSYRNKGEDGPHNTLVSFPPIGGHRLRARHELKYALEEWFHEQLHTLCTRHDPLLYPKPAQQDSYALSSDEDPDDGIPF